MRSPSLSNKNVFRRCRGSSVQRDSRFIRGRGHRDPLWKFVRQLCCSHWTLSMHEWGATRCPSKRRQLCFHGVASCQMLVPGWTGLCLFRVEQSGSGLHAVLSSSSDGALPSMSWRSGLRQAVNLKGTKTNSDPKCCATRCDEGPQMWIPVSSI